MPATMLILWFTLASSDVHTLPMPSLEACVEQRQEIMTTTRANLTRKFGPGSDWLLEVWCVDDPDGEED